MENYSLEHYKTTFNSRVYLETFYNREEKDIYLEQQLVKRQAVYVAEAAQMLAPIGITKTRFLDFGSGPTLHGSAIGSQWFDELFLAEVLDQNRDEILKVLNRDPTAFNWIPHFKMWEAKWNKSAEDILTEVCQKVSPDKLFECNVYCRPRIVPELTKKMNCIFSSLCIECCCKDINMYQYVIQEFAEMLETNGCLVLDGVLNQSFYTVGSAKYPTLNLNVNDVRDALTKAGFRIIKLEQFDSSPEAAYADYNGHFSCLAQRTSGNILNN